MTKMTWKDGAELAGIVAIIVRLTCLIAEAPV